MSTFENNGGVEEFQQQLQVYKSHIEEQLATKLDNINGINPLQSRKRALTGGVDVISSSGILTVTNVNELELQVDSSAIQAAISNMCPEGYAISIGENGTLTCLVLPINEPNGIGGLDQDGFVPESIFPTSVLTFVDYWNANDNVPMLFNSDCNSTYGVGDFFVVMTAGNTTLGNEGTWEMGDWVLCTKMGWQQNSHSQFVVDTTETQRRIVGSCSSPEAIQSVAEDGTVTCATTELEPDYSAFIAIENIQLPLLAKLTNVSLAGYSLTLQPGAYLMTYELDMGVAHIVNEVTGPTKVEYAKTWIIDDKGNVLDGSVAFISGKEIRAWAGLAHCVPRTVFVDVGVETTFQVQVHITTQYGGWVASAAPLTTSLLTPTSGSKFFTLKLGN